MKKIKYVRQQMAKPVIGDKHTCHWPGCEKIVPPALWGCREHWYRLPVLLRAKVWRAYRPGQEITKDPSTDYIEVAKEVQKWIIEHGT